MLRARCSRSSAASSPGSTGRPVFGSGGPQIPCISVSFVMVTPWAAAASDHFIGFHERCSPLDSVSETAPTVPGGTDTQIGLGSHAYASKPDGMKSPTVQLGPGVVNPSTSSGLPVCRRPESAFRGDFPARVGQSSSCGTNAGNPGGVSSASRATAMCGAPANPPCRPSRSLDQSRMFSPPSSSFSGRFQ